VKSLFRSIPAPFAMLMVCVFSLSLTGCGGSSAPAPRPTLTVTAANASRVYGAANPAFTASASGAAPGDTFTFTESTTATNTSPVGTYSIVPVASGTNLANYNVVYVNGTLTITQATLTVTAANASRAFGAANPTFTATVTGAVGSDTFTTTETTTATSTSPAGTYPIVPSATGTNLADYTVVYVNGTLTITPANNPGVSFSGKAMAGNLPITGATVQLYAAGTAGNGSPGSALLTDTLTTDSAGAFTVPAGYSCPAAASQLYVIVRGGQIGTSASNPAIMLATAIGACNQLAASSQFVINEVTTAAMAWGLSQFLSPGGNLGATATNAQGLSNAVATVANLANLTTGTSPGAAFPATGTSPAAKINSVANILTICTTTPPPDGCGPLFVATTPSGGTAPNNTLDAVLNLVRNPGNNINVLYVQSTLGLSPFTPKLTAAPSDWTTSINYTGGGMNSPSNVGVDSTGNVWVASYFGVASRFSPTGTPLFPSGITSGALSQSYGLAIDAQNNAWITNENSSASVNSGFGSVTVLSSTGQLISGATGYSAGGLAYPDAIAIDTNGTAWVADNYNASVTLLSASGQPLSGSQGYTTPKLAFPVAVAIDANHNGWLANESDGFITKVAPDGSQFSSYACCQRPVGIAIDQRGFAWVTDYLGNSVSQLASNGTIVSPASGYSDNKASIVYPQGIAIDGSGHVWVTNFGTNSITELAGSTANSPGQILSPTAGYAIDAHMDQPFAVAIDASGNLWIPNFHNNTLTEIVGVATPVKTPQLGPVQSP
jgi:sugar lactone lactonase YvrE